MKSNQPVHDEPMRNIDFFQIIRIMFRYAEQVQVVTLLIIANLKGKQGEIFTKPYGKSVVRSCFSKLPNPLLSSGSPYFPPYGIVSRTEHSVKCNLTEPTVLLDSVKKIIH